MRWIALFALLALLAACGPAHHPAPSAGACFDRSCYVPHRG